MKKLLRILIALPISLLIVFFAITAVSPQNIALCPDGTRRDFFRFELTEFGIKPEATRAVFVDFYAKTNVYGGPLTAFKAWMGQLDACTLPPTRVDAVTE